MSSLYDEINFWKKKWTQHALNYFFKLLQPYYFLTCVNSFFICVYNSTTSDNFKKRILVNPHYKSDLGKPNNFYVIILKKLTVCFRINSWHFVRIWLSVSSIFLMSGILRSLICNKLTLLLTFYQSTINW